LLKSNKKAITPADSVPNIYFLVQPVSIFQTNQCAIRNIKKFLPPRITLSFSSNAKSANVILLENLKNNIAMFLSFANARL